MQKPNVPNPVSAFKPEVSTSPFSSLFCDKIRLPFYWFLIFPESIGWNEKHRSQDKDTVPFVDVVTQD